MKKIFALAMILAMMTTGMVFADTTVYTTKTGTKYHSTSSCSGLNNANEIFTGTESDAIAKGLTKCSKCWDDSSSSSSSSTTTTVITETTKEDTTEATTGVKEEEKTTSEVTEEVVDIPVEPAPIVAPAQVKKITLTASKTKLKKGKKLKIKIKNASGKVKWSLSNKKAKIVKKKNSYIIIKGKKKGKVTVKAKVGNTTYKFKVRIK